MKRRFFNFLLYVALCLHGWREPRRRNRRYFSIRKHDNCILHLWAAVSRRIGDRFVMMIPGLYIRYNLHQYSLVVKPTARNRLLCWRMGSTLSAKADMLACVCAEQTFLQTYICTVVEIMRPFRLPGSLFCFSPLHQNVVFSKHSISVSGWSIFQWRCFGVIATATRFTRYNGLVSKQGRMCRHCPASLPSNVHQVIQYTIA